MPIVALRNERHANSGLQPTAAPRQQHDGNRQTSAVASQQTLLRTSCRTAARRARLRQQCRPWPTPPAAQIAPMLSGCGGWRWTVSAAALRWCGTEGFAATSPPAGNHEQSELADSILPARQPETRIGRRQGIIAPAPAAESRPSRRSHWTTRRPKDVPSQPHAPARSITKRRNHARSVPQSQIYQNRGQIQGRKAPRTSRKIICPKWFPAEAEFRQLIGDQTDGMFARFLQNKLKLMCWHRLSAEPGFDFRRATESGPGRGRPARPCAARPVVGR